MSRLEIIAKVRMIKQAYRRGDITEEQYHRHMAILRSHLR